MLLYQSGMGWVVRTPADDEGGDLHAFRTEASKGPQVDAPEKLLAPIEAQQVWAAGVTYDRSRTARIGRGRGGDFYDRVYSAERPELLQSIAASRRPTRRGSAHSARFKMECAGA